MNYTHRRQLFWNSLVIVFGNALYALTVALFLEPAGLVTGGATGIALAFGRLTGLSVSGFLLVFNLAMLVWGWAVLGRAFALNTLASSILSPVFLALWERLLADRVLTEDIFLCTVFAGLGIGVALGLVIRAGASTGGMDIPPLVLQKWFRLPVSLTMMVFDIAILLVQALFSPPEQVLYGIVMVILHTIVMDKMLLLGDSISCGGCSSSNINSEPFMKNWYELFADAVAEASGGNVKMDNSYSVGGQISDWSLSSSGESVNGVSLNKAQAAVLKEKPDLILIGWGMNDGTWHENQDLLAENVLKIIDSITFVYKEPVEFIVIGTCMPNDNGACYVLDSGVRKPLYGFQPTYSASLAEMCASVDNAVFVDAGEIHRYAIANKKYEDMTVNNVNHPNDFVIRMYAMNLSSAVIRDFGKQGQG